MTPFPERKFNSLLFGRCESKVQLFWNLEKCIDRPKHQNFLDLLTDTCYNTISKASLGGARLVLYKFLF